MDPELQDWINRVREDPGLTEEQRQILDDMEAALREREPGATRYARLLATFLERTRGRMPPVVRDFVKLYARALRTGADAAGSLGCRRYDLLRAQGASHEEAIQFGPVDRELAEWCRLRYELRRMPLPETGEAHEGIPGAPDEMPALPPAPIPNGPPWAREDDACCGEHRGSAQLVALDWGTVRLESDGPGGARRVTGRVTLSHPCGVLFAKVRLFLNVYAAGAPIEFFSRIPSQDMPNFMTVRRDETSWTFELHDVQLSPEPAGPEEYRAHDLLRITAVSRCHTTLAFGDGEQVL